MLTGHPNTGPNRHYGFMINEFGALDHSCGNPMERGDNPWGENEWVPAEAHGQRPWGMGGRHQVCLLLYTPCGKKKAKMQKKAENARSISKFMQKKGRNAKKGENAFQFENSCKKVIKI